MPHPRTAVVVGASLSGLMTALALARVVVHVTVLERSDDSGRTGAALHVEDGLLERITGLPESELAQPLASGVQTWFAAHAGLRAAVDDEPRIELRPNSTVRRVGQDPATAWVVLDDGSRVSADLVVGADGHRSVVRRHVAADNPDAVFAGYLIWLGIADEAALTGIRFPDGVAFLGGGDATLLGYPLAGEDGSTAPGDRRLGWAWYDSSRNELLRASGAVVVTVVHHSLMSRDIPGATFLELDREADAQFPAPWRDAIRDSIHRRDVIGTPVAEYVPDRLVQGRVALVGDAAHVPTPMTGSGFSESLYDAEALASALATEDVPAALAVYERMRLGSARSLVQSGQGFSRSFAGRAA